MLHTQTTSNLGVGARGSNLETRDEILLRISLKASSLEPES